MKDKGAIILRIKGPLKEDSQTEKFSRYILLHILFIKAEKERKEVLIIPKITLTLAQLRENKRLR